MSRVAITSPKSVQLVDDPLVARPDKCREMAVKYRACYQLTGLSACLIRFRARKRNVTEPTRSGSM
jgi:hypothetical protein